MNREMIEQLKQLSAKKQAIWRSTKKEERLFSEEEQHLIRQLDLERDVLLGDCAFNTY